MIKFFRRIRQKLLNEGKLNRYLIYGIGEIFLVVIGILIALQINNWNEDRKSVKLQKEILKDLLYTLIRDYPDLNRSISGNESSKQSCEIILSHFDNNIPYNDSLAFHFENAHLWWKGGGSLSAYERAKSHGLDFINDDSIRKELSNLYVTNYNFSQNLDQREALYFYNSAIPILTKLFESTEVALSKELIEGNFIPYDYELLKENKEYRTILRTTMGSRTKSIHWMNFKLKQMEILETKLKQTIDEM